MDKREQPTTVLVVDDHDAFRASAGRLLRAEGYEVIGEAADGESAITNARALTPDVILLDVQLPDIDGFEVTARLLGDGELAGRRSRIVLVSSRDRSDFGSLIDSCGACGFISKSDLSAESLARLIK